MRTTTTRPGGEELDVLTNQEETLMGSMEVMMDESDIDTSKEDEEDGMVV